MMKKYKILLLDADMTLLDFQKCEAHALKTVLSSMGIPDTDATVAEYSKINADCWKRLERGELTKSVLKYERFRLFFEEAGIDKDWREAAEAYTKGLESEYWLLDGAIEVLDALREKYDVYIITNGIASCQHSRLAGSGIAERVNGVFISEEIGFEKPGREYFESVAASIPGFDAAGTLVVGDSLSSDMAGARNFGLDSCWLSFGKEKPDGIQITYTVNDIRDLPGLLSGMEL